ncbi:MAG: hypothetical protein Fur0032_01700 [Terrimicrobiaceae bacterium]
MLHQYYSQAGQDLWVLRDVFGFLCNGYFVDIGAADGIELSNSYALEKRFGWRGLCIEADPESFSRLEKSRSARCLNVCLDAEPGEVAFKSGAGFFGGIVTGEAETAGTRKVTTVTLRDVFARENVPDTIHYLSLDVEGFEERVMQGFPFDTHKFLCATIERPSDTLRAVLDQQGYVLVGELPGLDTFYIHHSIAGRYTGRALASSARRARPLLQRAGASVGEFFATGLRATLRRL